MKLHILASSEDPKPPKAQAQDTVLCLDVSESLGQKGFEEMKQAAHKFVNGKCCFLLSVATV